MLGKLLKYDFKAILKYWWIAAISSLAFSAAGGACFAFVTRIEDFSPALIIPLILFIFLAYIAMFGFILASFIFIFTRFYKNFFTDEGYLTFTLPVTRFELLNSKLISSVSILIFTIVIFIIEISLFIGIPVSTTGELGKILPELSSMLSGINIAAGPYIYVFLAEGLIAIILSSIFSTLLFFCCITFACVISRKLKVLIAIGIYYVASGIISTCTTLFMFLGVSNFSERISQLSQPTVFPATALTVLMVLIFMAIVCLALYALEYWMLDRKLNLN